MAKTKRIIGGDLDGFQEITQEKLRREKVMTIESKIPTYTVPVVAVIPVQQQNCKGGDIDACQNSAWCAECIVSSREETRPVEKEKLILGFQEILDVPKFLAQKFN